MLCKGLQRRQCTHSSAEPLPILLQAVAFAACLSILQISAQAPPKLGYCDFNFPLPELQRFQFLILLFSCVLFAFAGAVINRKGATCNHKADHNFPNTSTRSATNSQTQAQTRPQKLPNYTSSKPAFQPGSDTRSLNVAGCGP